LALNRSRDRLCPANHWHGCVILDKFSVSLINTLCTYIYCVEYVDFFQPHRNGHCIDVRLCVCSSVCRVDRVANILFLGTGHIAIKWRRKMSKKSPQKKMPEVLTNVNGIFTA